MSPGDEHVEARNRGYAVGYASGRRDAFLAVKVELTKLLTPEDADVARQWLDRRIGKQE